MILGLNLLDILASIEVREIMRKFEFKVPDLFSDKLWEILESLWAAVCLQGRTGWQNYQKYIDSIIELQNTGFKSEKTRNRDETKIVVFKLIF